MAEMHSITIQVKPDTSGIARAARTIAKHLTAMADELEQPDALIKFKDPLTPEQVEDVRRRFTAHFKGTGA